MTTFAELAALTVEQTRRPEISGITEAAVRTAVLRAHHVDFFPKDLRVHNLTYTPANTSNYYEFADISSSVLRLRSFKHIVGTDSVTGVPVERLEFREADDLYSADNYLRPSIYTLIGDTLRLYPTVATGTALAYYYQNPNVSSGSFSSWIADAYPDELAMWAAAIVFARTGFTEQASTGMTTHIEPFKQLLVESHLLGNVS